MTSSRASTPSDASVTEFLNNFYANSDNRQAGEAWVQSFTDDAKVQIGADKARGTQEIRQFRTRMWARVAEREHKVLKVFPSESAVDEDNDEWEGMLVGEASTTTRDGRGIDAAWSAHAALRRDSDGWKLASYRVWLQGQ